MQRSNLKHQEKPYDISLIPKQAWNDEYKFATLPSSHRADPSHALVNLIESSQLAGSVVLDLGCGNGRNSFYLAERGMQVFGLDFSETALRLMEKRKASANNSKLVQILNHDITLGLPFADNSFDMVLDSYCLCHFVNEKDLELAKNEVTRVLKPGGKLIKIHVDIDDNYYLERIFKSTAFGHISYDEANGLMKMHHSLESYIQSFSNSLKHEISKKINFMDQVKDQVYERSIFISVLKKALGTDHDKKY